MSDSFTIRAAQERDLPYLNTIFAHENMVLPSRDMLLGGTVAVNANDEPVGFIYIYEINDVEDTEGNGAYVYPVIVYKDWQHHGVARALIDDAVKRYGAIKLVACAESQGFYPKAGFKPMDWSGVAGIIAKDCETCADLKTCHPQPFIRR